MGILESNSLNTHMRISEIINESRHPDLGVGYWVNTLTGKISKVDDEHFYHLVNNPTDFGQDEDLWKLPDIEIKNLMYSLVNAEWVRVLYRRSISDAELVLNGKNIFTVAKAANLLVDANLLNPEDVRYVSIQLRNNSGYLDTDGLLTLMSSPRKASGMMSKTVPYVKGYA